jgi:predicted PurR-regulated permease PerM
MPKITSDSKNKQLIGFFVLLGLASALALMIFWPFWQMLCLAGIFAVLFHPLYKKMRGEFRNENLSAAVTIFLVILIAILPLWFIGQLLFNEIVDVYNKFRLGELVFSKTSVISHLPAQIQNIVQSLNNDINVIVSKMTGGAFNLVSGLLSNLASFFLSLFLLIFMLFFFLRDGEKIKAFVRDISPLSNVYDNALFSKLEEAVSGVVKGSFLTALSQGIVGTIGYLIFGVPQPFLWGAFTVLAALVPTVGTTLAWVPAALFLFLTGHTGAGIGMTIWGMLAVGLIDNVLAPKLVGSKIQLHPLLVLISILGGIQLFGFLGFLFGPIIVSVFTTLLEIYRSDIKGMGGKE